jgi:hypothetical protein
VHTYSSMDKKVLFEPKRKRGRPRKVYIDGELPIKKVGLPAVIPPTCHDIREELSMLDSYTYSRDN